MLCRGVRTRWGFHLNWKKMASNFTVHLASQWMLERTTGERLALGEAMRLLAAIEATGHIAGACRICGVSYRHAWGVLRNIEKEFGAALLDTGRRKGTKLASLGQRLLWADRGFDARLMPRFESMSSELQEELEGLCPDVHPRLRLHASHGFAIEGLMKIVNQLESSPVELRYRTAIEALASLERGECDLAGFEVPEGEFEGPFLKQYGEWLDPSRHCLIHLAVRNMGLFVQPENPKNIYTLADMAKPNVRFVNRQIGSSPRNLFGLMLKKLGIETSQIRGYESSEFTHMDNGTEAGWE